MGILKVGVGAAQGVLADSWREYFYCDAMDVDVLAKKGEQRQSKRGSTMWASSRSVRIYTDAGETL